MKLSVINRRWLVIAISTAAFGMASMAKSQETVLPDLGSSAGVLITPTQEAEYGAYTLYQMRNYGLILDDPLIDTWLQGMGYRLGAASDNPKQPYTFFMVRNRQINAFATLGGYIGINAGLVLTANTEDEVAGVLSHEISHVTQKHMVRSVERAKKDQLPILLATLGMIVAAQAAGGKSADDATAAAAIGSQALMIQRQIDYTRSNESEADRIGIMTLYRAGYQPAALGDFFSRMESSTRGNSGGYSTPDYLRTHPVTADRISEARDRAQRLSSQPKPSNAKETESTNPLIPDFAKAPSNAGKLAPVGQDFPWAKERLRVLSAASPGSAVTEYKRGIDGFETPLTDAQKYGLALAYIGTRSGMQAEIQLNAIAKDYPNNLWIGLAKAEAAQFLTPPLLAQTRYEQLMAQFPANRAIILSYSGYLLEQNNPVMAVKALEILRQLATDNANDIIYQRTLARAYDLSGNENRAIESYAEVSYLNGMIDDAITQLSSLLKKDDLDFYQRARVETRIEELTPISLELKRQGIKAERQGPSRSS
jgi:predicted Zn-dependent protease